MLKLSLGSAVPAVLSRQPGLTWLCSAAAVSSVMSCFLQVTGAVGWRKDSLKYKKNEIFLDIVEQVGDLQKQ